MGLSELPWAIKWHSQKWGDLKMARVGRKAKPGKRHPNGSLRQPTRAQMEANERAIRMAETRAVLNQPHRNGDPDPRLGCEFGRFTVAARLSMEIYDAGEHYGGILRRWRSAMGIPTVERLNEGGGSDGPSDETVKTWARQINEAYRAMARVSRRGARCVTNLIADHVPVPEWHMPGCTTALIALAHEMGHLQRPMHRPVDIGKQELRASAHVPRLISSQPPA